MHTLIPGYFALLYGIYFLGHFCMSFVYGLGPPATIFMAAGLCAAQMITFWKASACSEDTKEAVWGICAGFFLWCLLGEFFEHEGILSLVSTEASILLVPCILLIAYVMYRSLLPVGMRFALGHFGCVWLLHAILVNQAELLKQRDSLLHIYTVPALGLAFLLIALLLLVKTFRARSEHARLACLLPSFIFFWAAMEATQLMDILPDYTCYAYWTGGKSSGSQTSPMEEMMDQQIDEMEKRYAWEDRQAEKRAYTVIKGLPSPHFIDDFTARLERNSKNGAGKNLDEKLFYRTMEESFVATSTSAFEQLLDACMGQFKSAAVSGRAPHAEYTAYPGSSSFRDDVDGKIAFIKERYNWDTLHTRDQAGYLLHRFSIQFLTGDDFIQRLDETLRQEKADTLGETLFCRAMKEHFAATCRTVFSNLMGSRTMCRLQLPRGKGEKS
jgi:hypothetical protein